MSCSAGLRGGGGPDVASELMGGLDEQDRLCRLLEELADSLPERLNTHQAVLLVRRLQLVLARAHQLEEAAAFPVLLGGVDAGHRRGSMVARLSAEHREDEDHAGDLEEALTAYVATGTRHDAEKIGYMMRCLFVGLRRHVAFDRDHVLPLLREPGA